MWHGIINLSSPVMKKERILNGKVDMYLEWKDSKITISGQEMGWDNAREYYHLALASPSSADRETNFAKTFQSLGQVIHLIEDMAVPAHVRRGA